MRLEGYIEFADIELANPNRTSAYVRALGGPSVSMPSPGCECDEIPGDFIEPVTDPAPWYEGSIVSEEFLGILATRVVLTPPFARDLREDSSGGARLSPLRRRARVLQVRGLMFASSPAGMRYGERWVEQVLAGSSDGCNDDQLRLLQSCPGEYRNLARVGIIDGPNFADLGTAPGCVMQEVTFQIASGVPFLLADPVTILGQQQLTGTKQACFVAANPGRTGAVLTIEAGSAAIEGVRVHFEPDDGGLSDSTSEYLHDGAGWASPPGSMPYVEFDVALDADTTLVFDSSLETIRVVDLAGNVVGGAEACTFNGGFGWLQALKGAEACVYVRTEGATINGSTSVMLATVDME